MKAVGLIGVALLAGCLEPPSSVSADGAQGDALAEDRHISAPDGALRDASLDPDDMTLGGEQPDAASQLLDAGSADVTVGDMHLSDGLVVDSDAAPLGCAPGSTQGCGIAVGSCEEGRRFCLENREWSDCQGQVLPAQQGCVGQDEDCDEAVDEGCECSAGAQRPCGSAVGRCQSGVQACEAGSWSACRGGTGPQIETCDGADNDCDGTTDEDQVPTPIACGQGQCRNEGEQICRAGQWVDLCSPNPAAAERCSGLDDNCDGAVDNVAGLGNMCIVGTGGCQATGTRTCQAGANLVCNASASAPQPEQCNGIDDNCDGQVDNVAGLGVACTVGLGPCTRSGQRICAGNQVGCSAAEVAGASEICNDIDDDCDGTVDEQLGLGDPCAIGQGICQRNSTLQCLGERVVCPGMPFGGQAETCNGLDDDCDGSTDENYADLGVVCFEGLGVCRRQGEVACNPDTGVPHCNAVARPRGFEECTGFDDDCDGRIDERDVCDQIPP